MLRIIAASTCVIGSAMALAGPAALSGQSIKDLIGGGGVDIEIDAPLGNKLPMSFSNDGRISGDAGQLASYLGSATDSGRWWITGDQLCSKWDRWLNGEAQCLRLTRDGSRIHWVNQDGRSGTATILHKPKPILAAATLPPSQPKREASPGVRSSLSAASAAPREGAAVASAWSAHSPAAQPRVAAAVAPVAPTPTRHVQAAVAPREEATASATGGTAASPSKQGPSFRVTNVDETDVLFVRQGPSAEHAVLGALMPDARDIRITGDCRSRWCPVVHRKLTGWVNRAFLEREAEAANAPARKPWPRTARDSQDAPRSCLTAEARALLERIEAKFGAVELVSTCRPGATVAATSRPSRHASGNAIDFDAGSRKQAVIDWLIDNHNAGGTMTYDDMGHIHVDIGRRFVSLAGRDRARATASARDWSEGRMGLSARSY